MKQLQITMKDETMKTLISIIAMVVLYHCTASSQDVTVQSRFLDFDSLATITDILHVPGGGTWVSSANGVIREIDPLQGTVNRSLTLGADLHITSLFYQPKSGAVFALIADGSLFYLGKNSEEFRKMEYDSIACIAIDHDTLWCVRSKTLFIITDTSEANSVSWRLPELIGGVSAIHKRDSRIVVGTGMGLVSWLEPDADTCKILRSDLPGYSVIEDFFD